MNGGAMGGPGSAPLPRRKDKPDDDIKPIRDGRLWYVKVRGFVLTGKTSQIRRFKTERAAHAAGMRMLGKTLIER